MSDKWHHRFLRLAEEIATWSKDPKKQVGAVIVSPDRTQITYGYNGFPRGIEDSEERMHDSDVKLELSVHAELNAILNAPSNVRGWTLYVTKYPCHECAKAIIQAGISDVVYYAPGAVDATSKWYASQFKAHNLFKEAGLASWFIERE